MMACISEPEPQQSARASRTHGSGPRFIVLEGLDGSGKSTLARGLATRLDADLLSTPLRELRSVRSEVDEVLGAAGLARTLWYAAHVAKAGELAAERLSRGRSVVLDRYWMSTLAYAACQGLLLELTEWLDRLTIPDVTMLLLPPHELRVARIIARPETPQPHDCQFMAPGLEHCLYTKYRQLGRDPHAGQFMEIEVDDLPVGRNVDRLLRAIGAAQEVVR